MGIVIDSCAISILLDPQNGLHKTFEELRTWILKNEVKYVIGGKKYGEELKRLGRFLKIFGELEKQGMVAKVDSKLVDKRERSLIKNYDANFNDFHIVALIDVSGCGLLCSINSKEFKYFTNSDYYEIGVKPKIISTKKSCATLKKFKIKKLKNIV